MMRKFLMLVAIGVCMQSYAQRKDGVVQVLKPANGTICYSSDKNESTFIGPPRQRSGSGKSVTADIIVTYDNFTDEAKAAFQAAVDIWKTLIVSPVTIHIHASWTPLGSNVLGSAGPGTYLANFEGAPKQDVWYPIALAEKIAGRDLNNAGEADIVASFNSTRTNWNYNQDAATFVGKYDLASVVLHEIGHGLGITNGYTVSGDLGVIPGFFANRPVVYETNIIDNTGKNLVNDFTPPSEDLKEALTSHSGFTSQLFFSSPLVREANNNDNGRLYAPAEFDDGSSIAHLDESTYGAGTINSLMTPALGMNERILDPGPISSNILNEMGWTVTVLEHARLRDTEDTSGPYHVIATIRNTNGYDGGSVTLHYKTTGSLTDVPMAPTGNPDEYEADIPGGDDSYSYYISVVDIDDRTFADPGVIISPGSPPEQGFFEFAVGPDNTPPVITHTPKAFITTKDDLDLMAVITDNIGIDNAQVEWKLNDVDQSPVFMSLVADTESTYEVVIPLSDLEDGDKIQYRIRAEDSSVAGHITYGPSSTTYYEVNVEGLGETRDTYFNDFNDLSGADFFGNGFAVSKPEGFDDGAIHSDHPYAEGGADAAHVDLIYNLTIPVRIAAENAVMKIDEIVLVEPGTDGVPWPAADFFDYVVVEGSKDGGVTWVALADGYDSREHNEWLSRWNSSSSGNNSTGKGDPSLYREHVFNLLDKFEVGNEVAFRFRLFSDPFSSGWGWSIDNLRIQVDDVPPTIKHQHLDFVLADADFADFEVTVNDLFGIGRIFVDYTLDGTNVTETEIVVNPAIDTYTQRIDLSSLNLSAGDTFEYRIRAVDNNGVTGTYPVDGFFHAAVVSFNSSADQVLADFEEESPDLAGNFFSIDKPNTFSTAGFATSHPYNVGNGTGEDGSSDISFLTKTPVKVSDDNPRISYEDIALVEYSDDGVKDYVVVEASKDGITWEQLVAPYAANAFASWKSTFDGGGSAGGGTYETHIIDMTADGKFKAGDVVLIRFRLHSDSEKTGWGWIVDNLSIQGPVTGLEPATTTAGYDAWPNPVTSGSLHLTLNLPRTSEVSVEFLTTQGQILSNDRFSAPPGDFQRDYEVNDWPNGFYLVRVRSEFGTAVKKIIKLNSGN